MKLQNEKYKKGRKCEKKVYVYNIQLGRYRYIFYSPKETMTGQTKNESK